MLTEEGRARYDAGPSFFHGETMSRIAPEFRQVLEWCADWTAPYDEKAIDRRRAFFRYAAPERKIFFARELVQLKRELDALKEKYAHAYLHDLELEAMVSSTDDVEDLYDLADDPGTTEVHRHRRFGALMLGDVAMCIAGNELPDSYLVASKDQGKFVARITNDFFREDVRRVVVTRFHDPADHFRVKALAVHDPEDPSFRVEGIPAELPGSFDPRHVHNEPLACRTLGGRLVGFHHRTKTPFDTYLKVLIRRQEGHPDPFDVQDRCGVKFLVPTEDERDALIRQLRDFIAVIGGDCRDDGRDPKNKRSSKHYRVVKEWIDWNDRQFEAQFMTFQDYYSSRFSTNEENHELYKSRACRDIFFPHFFPASLYGIRWAHPDVQTFLREQKIPQLNSRLDAPRP